MFISGFQIHIFSSMHYSQYFYIFNHNVSLLRFNSDSKFNFN
jgi:hypothetical protein